MSTATKTTRSLGRISAILSDIRYGQQRLLAANRVQPSKPRRGI